MKDLPLTPGSVKTGLELGKDGVIDSLLRMCSQVDSFFS